MHFAAEVEEVAQRWFSFCERLLWPDDPLQPASELSTVEKIGVRLQSWKLRSPHKVDGVPFEILIDQVMDICTTYGQLLAGVNPLDAMRHERAKNWDRGWRK